jgi:hypothetical protein
MLKSIVPADGTLAITTHPEGGYILKQAFQSL